MNRIIFLLKASIKKTVRIIFSFLSGGQHCIICGQKVYNLPICSCCINSFFNVTTQLKTSRCRICGKNLISTVDTCMRCRTERVIFNTDLLFPIFSYRLWNKDLLFKWKLNNIRSLSDFFACLVAEVLRELGIKYIVPVPPRPGKIRENGWDQIDELCKFLVYKYNFVALRLLKRNSKKQQKKLDRKNRLENMNTAYSMEDEKKLKKELKELKINELELCLIDDVLTTGATIESCAKLLKIYGFKKVSAITIFSVD